MMNIDEPENDTLILRAPKSEGQSVLASAPAPQDQPLISVVVRSMDRAVLRDALDSIALQTYANVEVVVVNAAGGNHSGLKNSCGRFPLRLVQATGGLARPAAANFGMENARGQYIIFLDDDDLFLANHLAKLSTALTESSARACYTGVRMVGREGQTILVLDEPWDMDRLRAANFLPIHAVLFERSLLDDGCRFREDLECLEDWDFWLQVASLTEFLHVPEVSAIYRVALGTSGLSESADAERHIANRALIFESWLPRFTSRDWVRSFYWFENARGHFYQMALDRFHQIAQLEARSKTDRDLLAETQSKLDFLTVHSAALQANVDHLNRQKTALKEITAANAVQADAQQKYADALQITIEQLVGSTSWKVTGPLRFVVRLVRGERRQAMDSVRRRLFAIAGRLGLSAPSAWNGVPLDSDLAGPQLHCRDPIPHPPSLPDNTALGMVDMETVVPLEGIPVGRIAVHAHIFYADVATEFADVLGHMPFAFDLFVSVPSEEVRIASQTALEHLPKVSQLKIVVVPNRGRDVAPMFCTFGEELRNFDYLAHIHSKKSLYNDGATQGWREYLLDQLFGSPTHIKKIFALLSASTGVGLVYPQNYSKLPYWANTWLSNKPLGRMWCQRLGIGDMPQGYFDYPAGSMFWARTSALKTLFESGLKLEDFPPETGQQDATFAHCLERLFALTANHSGYETAILRDKVSPRASPWGFEQYLGQTRSQARALIADVSLKVVAFDIFDTLLLRPLLNPESTKTITAQRADGDLGTAYLKFRAEAENTARQRAGRDVGLDAIYAEFAALSGLHVDAVDHLRQLEESVEHASVAARIDAVELLQFAASKGKRVVLASDMYLPKHVIESMLAKNGIVGWQKLYLSSDVGLRKDSGDLYRHILAQEKVTAQQMLMIGDNEHSDVQIPVDMGMKVWHVMRPVEMARAVGRLAPLVNDALKKKDLNEELALGLLLRANWAPVFYSHFNARDLVPPTHHALGYTVLGPLVLSFVQWLSQQAAADGTQRLYFLSREGEFLKKVYDIWATHAGVTPSSEYLVLSRRTVTVPMIRGMTEIEAIARTTYFENQMSAFVRERYGVVLTDGEWSDYVAQGLVRADGLVEVMNGEIDHFKPLLAVLLPRILEQAKAELPGLMAYLKGMGLGEDKKCAVVDVGYSATIQGRLNELVDGKVHGYYLMTDSRAEVVADRYAVDIKGCFGQYVQQSQDSSAMLMQSFDLEKLLSSDEAQIVRYTETPSGMVTSEVRVLSNDEVQCQPVRAEVRRGALKFVEDALAARTNILEDFVVPVSLGRSLYETLVKQPSEREAALLRELVLDDFYCGRDLVR
jgi:FMN phosphatase YigB (HAD superfamily)/glycosyltransferase involved in cell wall biosynthesis